MGRGSAVLHTTLCPNVVTRNLASALVCLQHAVALICGRWGEVKLSFVICFTHSAASQHSQSGPRLDRDMNQRMDGDEAENGDTSWPYFGVKLSCVSLIEEADF